MRAPGCRLSARCIPGRYKAAALLACAAIGGSLPLVALAFFSNAPATQAADVTTATIAAPTNFTATTVSTTSANLSWTAPATLTGYTLTQSTGSLAGCSATPTSGTMSCTATGLTEGTNYTWTLTAVYNHWLSASVNASTTTLASVTFTTAGSHSLDVPAGTTSVQYNLVGAGGGGGNTAGGSGGDGALQSGTISISSNPSGITLTVWVGAGGSSSSSGTGGEGCATSGYGQGGAGGDTGGRGGGGGGASCIYVASTPASPIVIAGGGGGGGSNGGGSSAGSGGAGNGGCGDSGSCASNPGTDTGSNGTNGQDGTAGDGGSTQTTGVFPYGVTNTGGTGGTHTDGAANGANGGTGSGSSNGGGAGGTGGGSAGGGGGGGGGGYASGGGGGGAKQNDSASGGGGGSGYSGGAQVSSVNYTVSVSSITQTGDPGVSAGVGGASDTSGEAGYATFIGAGIMDPVLAITSDPVSGAVSSTPDLGPITVQLEDGTGAPLDAPPGGVTVSLSTTSPDGSFSTTPSSPSVTSIEIAEGSSSASFYYGDTEAGTPTITLASGDYSSATQTEAITDPTLVITSSPVSGASSSTPDLGPITVQLQDGLDDPIDAPAGGVTVTLSSTSSGGSFSTTPSGSASTSVVIPEGSSSASFYYGDTNAGTPTISVTAGSFTTATQTETITDPALAMTSSPVSGASSSTRGPRPANGPIAGRTGRSHRRAGRRGHGHTQLHVVWWILQRYAVRCQCHQRRDP